MLFEISIFFMDFKEGRYSVLPLRSIILKLLKEKGFTGIGTIKIIDYKLCLSFKQTALFAHNCYKQSRAFVYADQLK